MRRDLAKWYAIKEFFWKDKSRDQNIASRDINTRFSTIKLTRDLGEIESKLLKMKIMFGHFQKIATTVNPDIDQSMINLIPNTIDQEDNDMLCATPLGNEIKKTLFSTEPDKSPEPDGFPPNFFQQNWEIVRADLTNMVQKNFITEHISKEMNASFISLIHKNLNHTTPVEFRPIALANTCYKIIFKLMAGRMKSLLEKTISPYQYAFVTGRQISENITLAHELIHKMKNSKSKKGFMGLKIDMLKAFERVVRDFLIRIMNKMGFNSKWCNLVHQCISTTTLDVLLNRYPTIFFKPTRGWGREIRYFHISSCFIWKRYLELLRVLGIYG